MDGKERNSNQPRNWEIMRTIVVQGRRGPLPAQLFPNRHACCCFRHLKEDRENERFLHSQLTKYIFVLTGQPLSETFRLNKSAHLPYNFALTQRIQII